MWEQVCNLVQKIKSFNEIVYHADLSCDEKKLIDNYGNVFYYNYVDGSVRLLTTTTEIPKQLGMHLRMVNTKDLIWLNNISKPLRSKAMKIVPLSFVPPDSCIISVASRNSEVIPNRRDLPIEIAQQEDIIPGNCLICTNKNGDRFPSIILSQSSQEGKYITLFPETFEKKRCAIKKLYKPVGWDMSDLLPNNVYVCRIRGINSIREDFCVHYMKIFDTFLKKRAEHNSQLTLCCLMYGRDKDGRYIIDCEGISNETLSESEFIIKQNIYQELNPNDPPMDTLDDLLKEFESISRCDEEKNRIQDSSFNEDINIRPTYSDQEVDEEEDARLDNNKSFDFHSIPLPPMRKNKNVISIPRIVTNDMNLSSNGISMKEANDTHNNLTTDDVEKRDMNNIVLTTRRDDDTSVDGEENCLADIMEEYFVKNKAQVEEKPEKTEMESTNDDGFDRSPIMENSEIEGVKSKYHNDDECGESNTCVELDMENSPGPDAWNEEEEKCHSNWIRNSLSDSKSVKSEDGRQNQVSSSAHLHASTELDSQVLETPIVLQTPVDEQIPAGESREEHQRIRGVSITDSDDIRTSTPDATNNMVLCLRDDILAALYSNNQYDYHKTMFMLVSILSTEKSEENKTRIQKVIDWSHKMLLEQNCFQD